jgi:hypothetical protein
MKTIPHCWARGMVRPATVMWSLEDKERNQTDHKAADRLGDSKAIQPEAAETSLQDSID